MELAFAATSWQSNHFRAIILYIFHPKKQLIFIMSSDKKTVEVDAKGIPLKSAYPDKPSVPGEWPMSSCVCDDDEVEHTF